MVALFFISIDRTVYHFDPEKYVHRSMWFGKIARQLGLNLNEVAKDDFSKLSNGLHLIMNKPMIKKGSSNTRRMGIEMVVLKPKSLSIFYLWVLVSDTKTALKLEHIDQSSLLSLSRFIEAEHAYVRVRKDKKRTYIKTQSALMGNFSHLFNANLEPHWHCHVVIFPFTMHGEQYFALQNEHIVKSAILYGLLYRADLMKRLIAEGFCVRVTNNKMGFFELDEVSEEIIDLFSSRSDEIEDHKRLFEAQYPNAPRYTISHLAKFKNRQKKSEKEVAKIIKTNVKKVQKSGFNREDVTRKKTIVAPINMAEIIYEIYQKEGEKLFEFSKERILKNIALVSIVRGIGAYTDELYKPFKGGDYVSVCKQFIQQQILENQRSQDDSRTRRRVIKKYTGGVFERSKRAYQNSRRTHKYFDEHSQNLNIAVSIAIDERLFTLCGHESGEYRETLRSHSGAKTMNWKPFFNYDDEVDSSQESNTSNSLQKPK